MRRYALYRVPVLVLHALITPDIVPSVVIEIVNVELLIMLLGVQYYARAFNLFLTRCSGRVFPLNRIGCSALWWECVERANISMPPPRGLRVHFSPSSHASLRNTKQCVPSGLWLSELTPGVLCALQCGRWCCRQRGGRLPGPRRWLQLHPSDPQRRAGPRPPGQPALRTHPAARPLAAPPTQAPTLPVHPPQAGRGGGHQALPLAVGELWALSGPAGQAGEETSPYEVNMKSGGKKWPCNYLLQA